MVGKDCAKLTRHQVVGLSNGGSLRTADKMKVEFPYRCGQAISIKVQSNTLVVYNSKVQQFEEAFKVALKDHADLTTLKYWSVNVTKDNLDQKLVVSQSEQIQILPAPDVSVNVLSQKVLKGVTLVVIWKVVTQAAKLMFVPTGFSLVTTKNHNIGVGAIQITS